MKCIYTVAVHDDASSSHRNYCGKVGQSLKRRKGHRLMPPRLWKDTPEEETMTSFFSVFRRTASSAAWAGLLCCFVGEAPKHCYATGGAVADDADDAAAERGEGLLPIAFRSLKSVCLKALRKPGKPSTASGQEEGGGATWRLGGGPERKKLPFCFVLSRLEIGPNVITSKVAH